MRRLRAFGRSVGTAFQIVDDLLDLTGDESEVGKSLGRDVYEGEPTLPVIHYLRTADAGRRTQLLALLQNGSGGTTTRAGMPGDARPYREIALALRDSSSIAYAEGIARECIGVARAALSGLPAAPARESLAAMAEFVLARRQ